MANTSIFAAFERMWQHILVVLGTKSDISHNHDEMYYTESEVDEKLESKADVSAIPSVDGLATTTYVDQQIASIPTPDVSGQINAHNTSVDAHADIRALIADTASGTLASANTYTDNQIAEIYNDAITDEEIDEICGTTIQTSSDTTF